MLNAFFVSCIGAVCHYGVAADVAATVERCQTMAPMIAGIRGAATRVTGARELYFECVDPVTGAVLYSAATSAGIERWAHERFAQEEK